jgi:glycosyltransferase involved in cell wall biosynthesis
MDQSAELVALDATVVICTYNRGDRLAETLDSLARSRTDNLRWDVIVVDNNSSDHTRQVVMSRVEQYPVALQYVFERQQGKSIAQNTGIAVTDATIIAFTDDDVRVKEGWLKAACRPMLVDATIDYTGGPIEPIGNGPARLARRRAIGTVGHAGDRGLRAG